MNICVAGTGYVGLVAGTCFADIGNNVICVDSDKSKVEKLNNGIVPLFEPGLKELIEINTKEDRLHFTTDLNSSVRNSDICFIAVGTPESEDGSCDISSVLAVARDIAKAMNGYKIIVNKSTVPVGTGDKIAQIIGENVSFDFDVVSNPEFLKQGSAVDDFLLPERVIIGCDSQKVFDVMHDLYIPFMRKEDKIIRTDRKSAEMAKYASNAFLATKISFINEIAEICEKTGANVNMVRKIMSDDERIGKSFLYPGIGYGGSCFPKDTAALINIAENNGCCSDLIKAVKHRNALQRTNFIKKITDFYRNDVEGKTFAVWGLAFKPKTNDMREAPSITVINELLNRGAKVRAFDPQAIENAKKIFGERIVYAKSSADALENADALLLLTEWNEFRFPDFSKFAGIMREKVIFDARNQYDRDKLVKEGFVYFNIGNAK